jgi:hypothetical protein
MRSSVHGLDENIIKVLTPEILWKHQLLGDTDVDDRITLQEAFVTQEEIVACL